MSRNQRVCYWTLASIGRVDLTVQCNGSFLTVATLLPYVLGQDEINLEAVCYGGDLLPKQFKSLNHSKGAYSTEISKAHHGSVLYTDHRHTQSTAGDRLLLHILHQTPHELPFCEGQEARRVGTVIVTCIPK